MKTVYFFSKNLILFFTFISFTIQANIITTIKPLAFITQAIAEGVIEIEVLLPENASPHTYSLKPSDIVRIKNADLVIWIGNDFETFLPKVMSNISDDKKLTLLELDEVKPLLYFYEKNQHNHSEHEHHDHHGDIDAHIWLSPDIARASARSISEKLISLYPGKKAIIDKNLENFEARLLETEQTIAKQLINVQNKPYFVFHDAYGYFERKFELNNIGAFTINPDIQPGIQTITKVKQELLDKKAVCIFREPQFNPAIITKVVNNTNVRVGLLDPLGVDIALSKTAYNRFLENLSEQIENCLK